LEHGYPREAWVVATEPGHGQVQQAEEEKEEDGLDEKGKRGAVQRVPLDFGDRDPINGDRHESQPDQHRARGNAAAAAGGLTASTPPLFHTAACAHRPHSQSFSAWERFTLSPQPQLRMRRTLAALPEPALPPGVVCRPSRNGEEI